MSFKMKLLNYAVASVIPYSSKYVSTINHLRKGEKKSIVLAKPAAGRD